MELWLLSWIVFIIGCAMVSYSQYSPFTGWNGCMLVVGVISMVYGILWNNMD